MRTTSPLGEPHRLQTPSTIPLPASIPPSETSFSHGWSLNRSRRLVCATLAKSFPCATALQLKHWSAMCAKTTNCRLKMSRSRDLPNYWQALLHARASKHLKRLSPRMSPSPAKQDHYFRVPVSFVGSFVLPKSPKKTSLGNLHQEQRHLRLAER